MHEFKYSAEFTFKALDFTDAYERLKEHFQSKYDINVSDEIDFYGREDLEMMDPNNA